MITNLYLHIFISVSIIDHRKQLSALDGNIRDGNKQRAEIIIANRVPDKFPLINAKKRTEAPTYTRATECPRIHVYMYAYIHLMHSWRARTYTHVYATMSLEASVRTRAAATRSLIIF